MTQPLFLQNIIACIWDFDKTLIPGYMQVPIFEHYQVDPKSFWKEVNALPQYYQNEDPNLFVPDTVNLNHFVTYAREGIFEGLNNALLKKLGAKLKFYDGLPGFFEEVKRCVKESPKYRQHEIQVEHYIVSTGLRQMILGSKIAPYIDGVWGCEFVENPPSAGFLDKPAKRVQKDKKIISQYDLYRRRTERHAGVFRR